MGKSKYVYMVRHGQSTANVDQNIPPRDAALTEKGIKESEQIADRLSRLPIEIIVSSPFPRAQQTAEIIAGRIKKPIIYNADAVEKENPPEVRGLSYGTPERAAIISKLYNQDDFNFRLSSEETLSDALLRADNLLRALEGMKEEHIALVSHGTFVKVLMGRMAFGQTLTPQIFYSLSLFFKVMENNGLTVFKFRTQDEYRKGPRWQLVTWNDYAHLG